MTDDKQHIPALDGLRGLAALTVIVSHLASRELMVSPQMHFFGAVGVSLFFTLSGFLMGYLYLGKNFTVPAFGAYAVSRFARIAPVYLAVIVASYFICRWIDPAFVYQINNANIVRHLLFAGNVGVLWSIPPEIQFYFFFVFLWAAHDRLKRGNRWPLAGVTIACLAMLYFSRQAPGTSLPSKLPFFLLGVGVSMLRSRISVPDKHRLSLSLVSVLLLVVQIIYAFVLYDAVKYGNYRFADEVIYFAPLYWLISAGTILCFSYATPVVDFLFANRAMRALGAWSFSLYLLHDPFLQIAQRVVMSGIAPDSVAGPVAVGCSIVAAWLANRWWEKPAQRFLKASSRSVSPVLLSRQGVGRS